MNIDTDLQFAFTEGVRDYMVKNIDYQKQIGNPEVVQIFQIKTYDPRKWLRESKSLLIQRLEQAFTDLNNVNTL
jgi:fructose-bisphosphate aldolase class II